MSGDYQIVALEEHILTADVMTAWTRLEPRRHDLAVAGYAAHPAERARLADVGDDRLAAMDAAQVDMQVLSLTAPGLHILEPADAVSLQRDVNDVLADTIRARPDRFGAFATLATPAPEAAARELERAVTQLGMSGAMVFGRTRDKHLDDPAFAPLLETAAALRAPLYLHPQSPPALVRDAYYTGLGDQVDAALATHGIGWHYDCGLELLRLILSGVFDRLPELQIITGHWGEVMMFFLDRIDANLTALAGLDRPISDYLRRNVYVTPSGILSERYLRWAMETIGADRIMFAADYPFVPMNTGARDFLDAAPLSPTDRAAIGSTNWKHLENRIRR